MLERSSIPMDAPRESTCRNESLMGVRQRTRELAPNQQTSNPANLVVCQLCLPLPFALSALLVGEVLLRDVERAVLSLDVAAREVLADYAKHGELKAAEQQD